MDFIFLFIFAALGAHLASFAGVISERLHTGESWVHGRSRCNSCARPLTWSDLLPILSWVVSTGRCRGCSARIPYRYTLAEVSLAVVYVGAYLLVGLTLPLVFLLAAFFFLTVIVLYDLRHTVVPMSLSLFLVVSSALYVVTAYDSETLAYTLVVSGSIGLGFFLMWVCSKGRWMGLGDAPVALALSLLTAHQAVSGLLFSFWVGAVIGIGILVTHPKGHRMGIEVPFVPFLAAGYLLAFFTQWHPFLF
jgi:prepilin signal peptidase PulO-like enzyme (type II secretory pathway)